LYKTQTQNDEKEISNIGEESTQMQYDLLGDIAIGVDCIGPYLQDISKATEVIYNTMQIGKNVSFNSDKLAQSLIEFNNAFQISQPRILSAIHELSIRNSRAEIRTKQSRIR
jgi:queuine/archaeosine tRNA-ribosyltransferase